jgi:hypothetical protein
MNPPPMNKLTIAAGITRNAPNIRKPNRKSTSPPIITRPRIAPSMKPTDARGATQGKIPTQADRKAGDNNATPLSIISTAAARNSPAGTHQYRITSAGRGNGPYQTPPEAGAGAPSAPIPVPIAPGAGIPVPICTGTFVR